MKYVLGLGLAFQLALVSPSWAQSETERLDRRYVIYDTKLGVIKLDTVLGRTWRYSWRLASTPQCKEKMTLVPDECQLWGWFPMGDGSQ
jgi:hypothetical protein